MRLSRTLGVVLLAGCSAGLAPDAGGLTAEQACSALAAAQCSKRSLCEPATLTVDFGDVATCTARERTGCLNSLSAANTGNTPDTVLACADAYAQWSCPDWFNNVPPDACKIRLGTLTPGKTCAFSAQCTSAFCALPTGATCGTCAPPQVAGSSCAAGVGCGGNGLYCDAASQTCQVLITSPGYVCDAGSCGYLLGCVMPLDGGLASCAPLVTQLDAGCDGQEHTAPACASVLGFACMSKHCVTSLFATAGEPCAGDRDAGTFTRCSAGASCGAAQTCVAPAAEGFDCDTAAGVDCLVPARCVSTNGQPTDGGPVIGKCALSSSAVCQ